MKKIIIISLLINLLLISLTGCANYGTVENESTSTSNYISYSSEPTEELTEPPTEKPTKRELSLDEFMYLCQEKYYDDFFKSTPRVGEYVKIYALTSQKYKYSSGDMQGILTEDITKEYNLALNSLGCCVLHEETKDDAVPSYFGKHIYIMFEKDAELNLDSFKTGQYIIIYGEIIKNDNGTFVLPKYIEEE